jgi:hypothetical protein
MAGGHLYDTQSGRCRSTSRTIEDPLRSAPHPSHDSGPPALEIPEHEGRKKTMTTPPLTPAKNIQAPPRGGRGHLLARVMPLVLTMMAMLAVLSSNAGAAPPPTPDPIIGDWNVTYGAPTTVTMTQAAAVYTETAKSPVRVTGSSCDLPIGTVIATFTQTGPGAYAGQHGMWLVSNCSFNSWAPMTANLSSDGDTLTAHVGQNVTFTKVPPTSP